MLVPKVPLILGAAAVGVIYLYGSAEGNSGSPGGTSGCRVSVTADILNVRALPDKAAPIVGKFKQGAETSADKLVQNGFRKVAENKWASAEFLKPISGDC